MRGRAGSRSHERVDARRGAHGVSARTAAWAGIVLGVLAAYVALPPIMLRTPVVSLVLAAAGVAAGVYAAREGERRLGNIAVALAVLGAILPWSRSSPARTTSTRCSCGRR